MRWPRYVVLRGRLAVQGDELLVPLGYGEFVPGQITPHGPGTAGLLIWL